MVLLRSLIRSYSEQSVQEYETEKIPGAIVENVNKYIVTNHGQSNMFATLFFGILDSDENKLYYVNGGQDPPVLVDEKGKLKSVLEPTGPAVGFSDEIPFEVGVVDFNPGDIILSYTDGLTEAKNGEGKFYSEKRLMTELQNKWLSALSLIKHLEVDVLSHIGEFAQFDDITLFALRRRFIDESIIHKLTLPAQTENLSIFRDFVKEVSQNISLSESITETMSLSVDEICANIILHGYKETNTGSIELEIASFNNEIIVYISDTGQSFDPSSIDSPNLSDDIDDRKIGGLGFFFVKEMVDEIQYSSQDGVNRMILKIKYD